MPARTPPAGVGRAHSCFGVAFKHTLKRTPPHSKIRVARAYSTIGVVRVFSAVRPLSCSSVLHPLELFGHTLVSELLSNISLSVLQHIGVAFKHKFKRTPLPGLVGRERTPAHWSCSRPSSFGVVQTYSSTLELFERTPLRSGVKLI